MRILAATVATSLALSLSPAIAGAEPAPLTGVELNTTAANSVAVDATFDFDAARSTGLPALKQLRGEMWDINPYFNDSHTAGTTRLREVARQHGLNTKEAYVNAVSIDNGLTRIAVQRAAEQGAHWGHTRPDGSELWSAKVNGQQTWAESLAAGTSLERSILDSWGHGELAALNNNRGAYASGAGHLHMMITPKNKYYGFSEVFIPGTKFGTYTAASVSDENGKSSVESKPMDAGKQRTWLYRPAAPGENPTGIKQGAPGSANQNNPAPSNQNNPGPVDEKPNNGSDLSAVGNVDINSIIGIVFGVLSLLGVIAGIAKQLGLI